MADTQPAADNAAKPNVEGAMQYDASFRGPNAERKCTDILMLLLFLAYLVGMFIVAGVAHKNGDPRRLYLPTDMTGMVCGRDNTPNMATTNFAYRWSTNCQADVTSQACKNDTTAFLNALGLTPDMTSRPYLQFISLNPAYGGICVSECANNQTTSSNPLVRVSCPQGFNYNWGTGVALSCSFKFPSSVPHTYPSLTSIKSEDQSWTTAQFGAGFISFPGEPVLKRCFPTSLVQLAQNANLQNNTISAAVGDALSTPSDVWSGMWGDINRGWRIILVCTFIAFVVAFIFLLLLRLLACPMVWFVILATQALLVVVGGVFYKQGSERLALLQSEGRPIRTAQAIQGFGIVFLALAGIFFLLTVWLLGRIRRAIGIIQETTKALAAMPSLLFVPIPLIVVFMGFIVYWIAISIFLVSSGNTEIPAASYVTEYAMSKDIRNLFFYHLLGGFWIMNLLIAFATCTIAGAVASWYFTMNKSELPMAPILASLKRAFVYHLGSLAFGALIIAIIQTVRVILAYVQRQAEKHGATQSKIVKAIFCCMQCCLACFERFMKFINKQAYIQLAIFGKNFCASAKDGSLLIIRNILIVGVVNTIGDFVLFLVKLFISFAICFIAFEMANFGILLDEGSQVQSPLLIAALVWVIGYGVASICVSVFETGVDTILQCFAMDGEMNKGRDHYATDSLKKFFNDDSKASKGCC